MSPTLAAATHSPRFLQRFHAAAAAQAGLVAGLCIPRATFAPKWFCDALGVTAAFNLNVLRHVNRVLGSDFDLADWRHVALFNEGASRIEMHLEARRDCVVTWPGGVRRFAAGERIHSENSCKYTIKAFDALLHDAGYTDTRCWTDPQRSFAVFAAA